MDNTNPQNQQGQTGQQQGQPPVDQTPPAQMPANFPPAGQMPASGANPFAGMSGMPPPPPPPPEDNTPANFQLGALFKDPIKIKLQPHPDTKFEDEKFLMLLASSISLSRLEKKRIIEAVPKLQQWQVDELINIFEEEKQKFAQLSKRHVPQLEKLAKQHYEEWRDIELEDVKTEKAQEDKGKADEIRKKLGL
ncbi:hypothetical protein JW911_04200 [Candidatus Peregrinibacteria bacterium]|nr:hypothetical protein [Candidatus Peregrinibacteria bacterium]